MLRGGNVIISGHGTARCGAGSVAGPQSLGSSGPSQCGGSPKFPLDSSAQDGKYFFLLLCLFI